MSSRDTHRDSPLSKSSRDASPDDGAAVGEPKTVDADADKTFDPYRFQANTMPPGLRQEILAAKPLPVPEGRFDETMPPNVVIGERRESDERSALSEPPTLEERGDRTLVAGRSGRASSLPWLLGGGVALVAFVVIVLLAAPRTTTPSEASVAPSATQMPEPTQESIGSTPAALGKTETHATPPASAAPTGASVPLQQPSKSAALPRNTRRAGVGATPHEKPETASLPDRSPMPRASARAGAFATPLAPPDK
jgi:hypothetical protein